MRQARGITILEVIISLLILGGCMAAIGQFSRNAFRNARESKDMVQAELLAESILAKVRLGIVDMEPAFDVSVTNLSARNDMVEDTNVVSQGGVGDVLWLYTLEVTDVDDYGLVEIAVTVRQNLTEENRPVSCRLVRWLALEPEEEETTTETTP